MGRGLTRATIYSCTHTHDEQEVCKQLGIPFHRADFSRPYWTNVFAPFLEGYER